MSELRLTSIALDDLRSLFSGSPAIEAHLEAVAAAAFPTPTVGKRSLLDKVGPLTKVPANAPVLHPERPTRADVHDVTRGRFVPPERLPAAWTLVRAWVDACGWPTCTLTVTAASINDLDFELATGGVPTRYALRALLNDKLALPLRNGPGQATGYVSYDHARAMREAWAPAIPTLSPHHAQTAQYLVGWLGGLEGWAAFSATQGRPRPDLVALFRS